MRKTTQELAEILFHAYESGDVDNIFYGGKWNKMSDAIKKELDNIELEDLAIIRENSYGIILNRIHREIDQDFVSSMLTENMNKNILPELVSLHFLIGKKYFNVLKKGKKISPSLYATPQQLNAYIAPISDKLAAAAKGENMDESVIEARFWASVIGYCNPFFHALKTSPEFVNVDLRTLVLIVIDYLNQTYGISQELLEKAYSFNTINNWTDLFPRTKRDLKPFIDFSRKRIGQQSYLQVPQNPEIHDLITSFVDNPTPGQLDILNNYEINISNKMTLIFEGIHFDDKEDLTPISVKTKNGMKTLAILMQHFFENPNIDGDVKIPIATIKELRKYGDERTARRETLKAIYELSRIGFYVKDKGKPSGFIRLNAGIGFIKNGFVCWRFTREFIPFLTDPKGFAMDFRRESLGTDDKKNPNAFYLAWNISRHYRMNEGKDNESIIKVKTLIDNCPDLKDKYENSRRKKEDVMIPLIRDLDSLDWLYYTWYTPDGKPVEDINNVPSKTFFDCYIKVDYSDFPKHPDRLKHKEKRKQQLQRAIDNARAKSIVKKEEKKENKDES